jgi:E3 ubiquitin-protein ligase HUWE1
MISEVSPLPTVLAIATKVKESVRFITNQGCDKSMLIDFIDVKADDTALIERGNKVLRQMIELHGYVGLLSNICCSSVLSHGKNGVSLVTEFLSETKDDNIIQLLGQLHRVMVWENLLLKDALPPSWYAFKPVNASALKKGVLSSTSEHPLGIYNTGPSDNSHANTPDESGSSAPNISTSETVEEADAPVAAEAADRNAVPGAVASTSSDDSEKAPPAKDPRMSNIKHFKLLLTEIPQLLMPIFQGIFSIYIYIFLNVKKNNTNLYVYF